MLDPIILLTCYQVHGSFEQVGSQNTGFITFLKLWSCIRIFQLTDCRIIWKFSPHLLVVFLYFGCIQNRFFSCSFKRRIHGQPLSYTIRAWEGQSLPFHVFCMLQLICSFKTNGRIFCFEKKKHKCRSKFDAYWNWIMVSLNTHLETRGTSKGSLSLVYTLQKKKDLIIHNSCKRK